jgi:hypothetical protein
MLRSKMLKFVRDGGGGDDGTGGGDEPSWHEFLIVPATNMKERRVGSTLTVHIFQGCIA